MSSLLLARLFALFLLGLVLFLPPIVTLPRAGTILGIPSLFAYLFGSWAALIGLLAVVVVADRDGRG